MKIIVGVTGASGAVMAQRLVELLADKNKGHEVHVVVSTAAQKIAKIEGAEVKATHAPDDFNAPFASGSYDFDAMIIVPCSMKTLSCVANGYSDNLITRAADVALKQERKLILVPRETPLNLVHLRNLVKAKEAGASIVMPVLSFYNKPKTLEDAVDFVMGRVLDLLGLENNLYKRWKQ